MEEDIKIIKASKIMSDDIPHSEHSKRLRKALENLIKGYRELEEQIDKHVYFETTNPKEIEKNFIPKSKIKSKIEEVNKSLGYSPVNKILIEQVLQELMEDK